MNHIQALEALLAEKEQDRSDFPENTAFYNQSEAIREAIEVLKLRESGQLVRVPPNDELKGGRVSDRPF